MSLPGTGELTRRIALLVAAHFCLAVCGCLDAARAEIPPRHPVSEYRVKGAFLYNFTKFVSWPESAFENPDSPFFLCVLEPEPLRDVLNAVRKREAQGRPFRIRNCKHNKISATCHVVFLNGHDPNRIASLLQQLDGKPVLTVGEIPGFTESGGMIRFFVKDRKVKFEINLDAVKEAGLSMSSRLLSLAQNVYRGTHKEGYMHEGVPAASRSSEPRLQQ